MADLHSTAPALTLDPVPGIITATLTLTGIRRCHHPGRRRPRADDHSGAPVHQPGAGRKGDARADLQYIGLSSDLYQDVNGPIANHRLYFGLTTYGAWSSPNEVTLDIYIDTDEDGVDDYRLSTRPRWAMRRTTRPATLCRGGGESGERDVFGLRAAQRADTLDAETAPFRTNVMVLPVRAVDIGLSDADTGFDYRVETWAGERLEPVEVTPVLHYDMRTAGLDLVGRGAGAVLCGRARRP
ncbi:MAG: hypothetical protein R2838_20785 [Caldilineaceae bacterium]